MYNCHNCSDRKINAISLYTTLFIGVVFRIPILAHVDCSKSANILYTIADDIVRAVFACSLEYFE